MRYIKAEDVLPAGLLAQIQEYVDGAYIYIPRRQANRQSWGSRSGYRAELAARNRAIRTAYAQGEKAAALAEAYHLSEKSIARILREKAE